jgi:hypothetical protein
LTTDVQETQAGKVVNKKIVPEIKFYSAPPLNTGAGVFIQGNANNLVKYIQIKYPDGKPTQIPITDTDGNITEEGRQLLKGEITVPYLQFTSKYGMPSGTVGYKAGQKVSGEKVVVTNSEGYGKSNPTPTPASNPAPKAKTPVFNMKE